MAERTVFLRLGMKISDLQSQAKAAEAAIRDFSKKSVSYIERNGASINDLANRVGGLGIALTGVAAIAVKQFASFDKEMSNVRAATGATAAEMTALREAAIKAGADTAFSAQEAAAGVTELAKAGVSTANILSGGLDGALALAAAGEIGVAEAAETAASTMTQFGLAGTDVTHIADLLAAGANKAQGGVSDLGQALNQSGLIAAQTGLTVEETTAALSAFASAGLLGSDAGTSFKTSLQALSAPSSTAAKEMERLGISAYDAQGNFIGLEALAGNLETALADLTPQQRNSALATIFGSDAIRAASILYEEGAAGIREWADAVDEQGYAAQTAALLLDNLAGDVESLSGSLDTVFIQSGSGANDVLREMVQNAEAVVDAIGEIPAPVLSATTLIAGAGGLALLGIAGLGKLAVAAVETRAAMTALGISTRGAALAAGGLGAALAVGTVALTTWAQNAAEAKARTEALQVTLDEFGGTTEATLSSINETLSADQRTWADRLLGETETDSLIDRAGRIGLAVEDLQGYILGNEEAVQKVTRATEEYLGTRTRYLTSVDAEQAARDFLIGALDDEARALTDAEKAAAQKKIADDAAGISTKELGAASLDAAGAVGDLTDVINEQWKALLDAAGATLSLRDAQRQAEAAFDDARQSLKDNGQTLDINTAKGRANQAALDAIASAGWDLIDSMQANGATASELGSAMATTRERFIETATSMGMSKREAKDLADQLNLIPKNVKAAVTVDTSSATAAIATIDNSLRNLDGKTVTAAVVMRRLGQVEMASGGAVFGGTPGKDSVPVMAMPGEHMLTTKDVAAMGGQGAVYAFRAALHSGGVQAMADGGAVAAASGDVRRWSMELARARAALRSAQQAERAASRTASEADDRAAARGVRLAERRLERAEKALDDARSRRARLREEAADLRTSLRRGTLRDQVTGGLSGAYSAVDQLRDLAGSGDLGRGRAQRLRGVAGAAERELRGLYTGAARAEKQLAKTRDRLDELRQIQNGVQSQIVGGFRLGDVRGSFDPATGKRVASGSALAAAAKEYASKAKRFGGLLEQLRKKSGSGAIVAEVAGYGVEEGVPLAESLLSDLPSLKSLAASLDDIQRFGARAGAVVAHAVGGQSISEAQRAARAAQANVAAIDKRIGGWAKKIGVETARALGVKPRAQGGDIVPGNAYIAGEYGRELIVPQQRGYVLSADATRRLAVSAASNAAPSMSTSYQSNLTVNTNQVVTPDTLLRYERKRQLLEVRR